MGGFVMALDQGTTSSRAIIFNKKGEAVATGQIPLRQIYPRPGWVEHDPAEILSGQLSVAADALERSGLTASDIAAIGVTNQRETTIVWDKNTGKPVCNAIVWQCRRTAGECERLKAEGLSGYVAQKTGLLIDAYFSATKIKWILRNVSSARERAEKGELLFGTVDSWLIWNLTGGKAHVTDYSNASRTMLFDIDAVAWDETLCKTLGIPMSMLPKALPSSGKVGEVARGAGLDLLAGVPICGFAGDQAAALFGQGCFKRGMAKNTYGTGCFTLMNIGGKSLRSSHGLLTSVAWEAGGQRAYAMEGSAFNTGAAIQWLRDELGLISTAKECDRLAESVESSGGVYFVPAFTGLGAPYWDMYARGLLCGITRGTGRAHIARSVLESIAYQVTDLVETMQLDTQCAISELRVDGGASVSNILMSLQADMLGIPVNRPRMTETTAFGAAALAGLAAGFWSGLAELEQIRVTDRVFTPSIGADRRRELYAGWKEAVERARS